MVLQFKSHRLPFTPAWVCQNRMCFYKSTQPWVITPWSTTPEMISCLGVKQIPGKMAGRNQLGGWWNLPCKSPQQTQPALTKAWLLSCHVFPKHLQSPEGWDRGSVGKWQQWRQGRSKQWQLEISVFVGALVIEANWNQDLSLAVQTRKGKQTIVFALIWPNVS